MLPDSEYRKRRREADPEYHEKRKEASRAWKARHVKRINAIVREAKNKPCVDCGHQFPPVAMDFDHVRGDKKFSLAKAARRNRTIQEVLDEIAKCEIRCAVCHRIRHGGLTAPG
jgi:hypothetical protein